MLNLKIIFSNKTNYQIPRKRIKVKILSTLNQYKVEGKKEIGILFCSENQIKKLNQKYRHKNEATSVLSFPLEDDYLLGDIVFCPTLYKKDFQNIDEAVGHATLHLIGIHH